VATKDGRSRTAAITREEFKRLEARVEELKREYSLQFSRIAQMQAELDQIRTAWTKRKEVRAR
jgi:archaellum component FlaC